MISITTKLHLDYFSLSSSFFSLSLSLSHLNIINGGREYNSLVLFFPRFEIDGIREGEKCKYLVLKIEKVEKIIKLLRGTENLFKKDFYKFGMGRI